MNRLLLLWVAGILGVAWMTTASAEPAFRDDRSDGTPCTVCPLMRAVPAGAFNMGSSTEIGHNDERGPGGLPITVSVPRPFAIGAFEITRGQFAAFVAANPDYRVEGRCGGLMAGTYGRHSDLDWRNPGFPQTDDHPVVCVSWRDAAAFAAWLATITGQPYRLPTEAEWEYAARAGSRWRYWWGPWMNEGVANCRADGCGDSFRRTAPVGSLLANPFGLHDTAGNAWEWAADCYAADAYRRYTALYPNAVTGPASCNRVIRGGSWWDNPWSLRAANRDGWRADVPSHDVGFRVARNLTGFRL